ncbi:MAG: rhodanese-like domain-containing protein [Wenzhouxiangellaceae bacterium]
MTKRIPIWLGLLALLLAMAAQAPAQEQDQDQASEPAQQQDEGEQAQDEDSDSSGPWIYPTLAVSLIEMGVPVIDVRSAEEVEETGTLAGAEHIPHTEVDELVDFIGDDTARAVILYCGSGRRAARAIDNLRERGYHGMVNAGGYEDLREALQERDEQDGEG